MENKTFKIILKLKIRKVIMGAVSNVCGIDNKKIVFSSYGGKQYSDSGRIISEELHRRNQNLEIVWLLNKNAIADKYGIIPDYVIKKENNFKNSIKEIATSHVYISNEDFPIIYKNKKQMFIDTWHADRLFKKVLYESNRNGTPVYDDKVVDLCVAGSEFGVERYRKAFLYNGKIINEGMPRNDALVNFVDNKKIIKDRLGLKNEKIILYAPTFRDNNSNIQNISIDFDKILSELSKDGNEWKLLIRSHTASKGVKVKVDTKKMIDVTDYPDTADILQITDFLISDYSSVATDFALTEKPIILFIYDYEDYEQNCRGYIVDPKTIGFVYATDEDDLINKIRTTKVEEYINACKKANDYYKINETGKSTGIICDYILSFINKKDK